MPTSLQLADWLREQIERSAMDCRMASEQEWIDFHEGEYDAFNAVLEKLEGRA
jgi:putative sterol carrier protein